ncbi:hypothetical protein [Gracilimonas sp.]|uniref:hypothetical protein n=1 Tax=Gracilimonas sp. TaxID=1974203 RepID=UPI003D0EA7DD
MTKETLIKNTVQKLTQLPQDRIKEVDDFAAFILKRYEEETLQKGIESLVGNSKSFDFLKEEEVVYTTEDLKEKYE